MQSAYVAECLVRELPIYIQLNCCFQKNESSCRIVAIAGQAATLPWNSYTTVQRRTGFGLVEGLVRRAKPRMSMSEKYPGAANPRALGISPEVPPPSGACGCFMVRLAPTKSQQLWRRLAYKDDGLAGIASVQYQTSSPFGCWVAHPSSVPINAAQLRSHAVDEACYFLGRPQLACCRGCSPPRARD